MPETETSPSVFRGNGLTSEQGQSCWPTNDTLGRLYFIFVRADMQGECWVRPGLTKQLLKPLVNWKGHVWHRNTVRTWASNSGFAKL